MSNEKETARNTGGAPTATAVDDRPARSRPARGGAASPAPDRTRRRGAPPRAVRRGPAQAVAVAPRGASSRRVLPRTPFVLLVVGLLCGGLVSLLLLNVVLQQDSFRITELHKSTQRLRQQEQDINTQVLLKSQPRSISERAGDLGSKADGTAPKVIVLPPEGATR